MGLAAGAKVGLAAALTLAIGAGVARAASGAPGPGPSGGIQWGTSFENGLQEAAIEGRLLMADFYTSWCGWCKVLDRETYADPEVIRRAARVVCVRVDAEQRKDLAKRFRIRGYPTIGFFRSDGAVVQLVVGYQPPRQFRSILDRLTDRGGEEFTLRERLKDHPELAAVRCDLARILLAREAALEAVAEFDSALAVPDALTDEQRTAVHLDRGRALLKLGRAADARQDLQEFVAEDSDSPKYPVGLFFLAEACLVDHDPRGARKWYGRLLEIQKDGWLADRARERLAGLG